MVARVKFCICLNVVPTRRATYNIHRKRTHSLTHRMGVFEFGVLQMDEQQMNVIVQFYDAFHMDTVEYILLVCDICCYIHLILMIQFFFWGVKIR